MVPLMDFLKLFKCLASSSTYTISSSKLFAKRARQERREFSQDVHVHLELWLISP